MIKVLVTGLSGSGKTYLSQRLEKQLAFYGTCVWLNADKVRAEANDWDFSYEGRVRQSNRMVELAQKSKADFVILDFIAPLEEIRNQVDADWVVWMDTVNSCAYPDTNFMFQPPSKYDFHISKKSKQPWDVIIAEAIVNNTRVSFNPRKPTVQMLGRFQPWHDGHQALFERAIAKTGQVAIMVRDCYDYKNNPFTFAEVEQTIRKRLDEQYQGLFEVFKVPNIVNITYGRDVGYDIEQEHFDYSIESISATKIRKTLEAIKGETDNGTNNYLESK